MARFRYKLQNVLNIKEKLETQAKQDFSNARKILTEEEEKRDELIRRKEEYHRRAMELRSGTLNVLDIEANQNAMLTMDSFIAQQNVRVSQAEQAVERAREHMTAAMQERKTYETLREKAFEAFLQEENRAESKSIDELTSYTYGQRTAQQS